VGIVRVAPGILCDAGRFNFTKECEMKRFSVFLLVLLLGLLLTGCAATEQQFVQLPGPLQAFVTGLVIAAVGWLFTQLFQLWPWLYNLLGQYVGEVGLAAAAAVLGLIQNFLNLIPPQWETAANLALALIVEILIALGVSHFVGKVKQSVVVARARARLRANARQK